jgi:hypothetical protein
MGDYSLVVSSHIPHLESRRQGGFFYFLKKSGLPG